MRSFGEHRKVSVQLKELSVEVDWDGWVDPGEESDKVDDEEDQNDSSDGSSDDDRGDDEDDNQVTDEED